MYESISKNKELENEMTLDMSYFWYSDVSLKLMDSSLHLIWPPLSKRQATVGSLLNTLLKGQAGKIKKLTMPWTW